MSCTKTLVLQLQQQVTQHSVAYPRMSVRSREDIRQKLSRKYGVNTLLETGKIV